MRPHRLARLLDGSLTLHAHGGVDPATVLLGYAPLAWWALHRLVTLRGLRGGAA